MAENQNYIGVAMGLDVTDLKAGLSEANKQIQLANSEFKAASSGMDDWTKSTEGLTAKVRQLDSVLNAQKSKLAGLQAEYERVAAEQGENSEAARKLKIQLNNQQAVVNRTQREFDNYSDRLRQAEDGTLDLENATDRANSEVKDFGDTAKDTGGKLDFVGGIAKGVVGGIVAIGAAAVSAATALAAAAVSSAEYADNILTMSTVTGVSTDKLQEYSYAAELVDVSVETLTKSMAKNIKSMKAAQDGTKLTVEAYDKLGVSATNADGSLRDSETVYWEIIDALGAMENETERDAVAMQILGKSAQELNPLIEAGAGRMKELGDEARNVGAVMSSESLEALGAFDDSLQRLKGSAGAAKNELGTVLLPQMISITEAGGNIISEFANQLSQSGGGLNGIVEAMKTVSPMVTELLSGLLTDIAQAAGEIIPSAVSTITQGLSTTVPTLLDVILPQIPIILESVLSQTPLILKTLLTMVEKVAKSLAQMLPTLIPVVINAVIMLAETLLDNIDLIIDAGIALIFGLADGLIAATPQLIDKIPVIIEKLVGALVRNMPKLVQAGIELTVKLASGLIQAIPKLIAKIPKIITSIVKGFKEYYSTMGNIGLNLVKGIWNGISGGASWLKDKIVGFAGNVSKWFKDTFKIKSPSQLMEDEVGRFIGEGVGVGVINSIPTVKKQLGKFSGFVTDNLGGIKSGLNVNASGQANASGGRSVGGTVINAGVTVHYNGNLSRKQIKQLENDNYTAIRTRLRAEGAI